MESAPRRNALGWLATASALALSFGISLDRRAAGATEDRPATAGVAAAAMEQLVSDLGSDDFGRREKARERLRQLGLAAFEPLCEAQDSDDVEIALSARYLLHSLAIRWAREDDPLEVKELLRGYAGKSEDERRSLMDQLAALPDACGIGPLCRIVRFESSNELSKRAALRVMQSETSAGGAPREATAAAIRAEIGNSRRPASDWVRTLLASWEEQAAALEDWRELVLRERAVFQHTPERSSNQIVRELLQWHADLLQRSGRPDEAAASIRETVDLLDGTRSQLLEMVDWLLQRKSWDTVEEILRRFPERFGDSAELRYRLAESRRGSLRQDLAEQTAREALAIAAEEKAEHNRVALALQERGQFDWAEREYRFVIDTAPAGSEDGLRGRFLLSEMLHDQQREREAAELLQDAVTELENDGRAQQLAKQLGREANGLFARMHFFRAEQARAEGDVESQRKHLTLGIEQDPGDADVLISMYRLENADPEWRENTRRQIRETAEGFREEIERYQQEIAQSPNEEIRSIYQQLLASAHNQFAWLVANTEGDFEEAVRSSRRSLELLPNTAGYLDTLGRCYFAQGDLENAVKYQRRAVDLEPHTGQIRRQLELFEAARAAGSGTP